MSVIGNFRGLRFEFIRHLHFVDENECIPESEVVDDVLNFLRKLEEGFSRCCRGRGEDIHTVDW